MKKQIELTIRPEEINLPKILLLKSSQYLKTDKDNISSVILLKRSIDARSKFVVFRYLVEVYIDEKPIDQNRVIRYEPVREDKKVIIVGFGPGGMYSALRLIELGIKPVIIERGKDVQTRRRDIRAIQQEHIVNPDSNYCFGEGGAGAYSDGKLYTRSTKRGDVKKVLDILVQHGADPDIRIDTHPHIGSNILPKVVSAIRKTILNNGGEIYFNSRVTDFILKENKLIGVRVNDVQEFLGDAVILATGHSARDIYYLLHKNKIKIEPKPFAMGVRIEHPQDLINEIQYHTKEKHPNLPSASYNFSCNIDDRGVYSFCMCPGGIIVPAATAPGEIVVNGMSLSKRNSPFANSGFVVEVNEKEWSKYDQYFPFSGLMLQKELEQNAFELANKTQSAPAQRVTDFVSEKLSSSLPESSYIPGLTSASLHKELPQFISSRLKKAISVLDKKKKGYYSEEAILVGVESRTSSPIRIPRNKESLMHTEVEGLFPCGEGAGYAGGIVSSAIDGENCADAVGKYLK
ncbi:MAG: FAD-binding protein [Ignavibacteriaceae bacterium]|nr:FAD-binding protein [Ignavibacteriaceae bacterium]